MKIYKFIKIITVIIFSFIFSEAQAQQLIINVPNSDVLNKGKSFVTAGARFRPFNPDKFAVMRTSLYYGIGHATEVIGGLGGLRVVPNNIPFSTLNLGVKKVFPLTDTTKFTVTSIIYPQLTQVTTPFNISFAHLSQEIPQTKTRFTAGMYLANGKSFMPDKPGVTLGFEQPLFDNKVLIVTDWLSGNDSFTYYSAGFKYRPTKTTVVSVAANIPNGKQAKLSFILYFAKYLN